MSNTTTVQLIPIQENMASVWILTHLLAEKKQSRLNFHCRQTSKAKQVSMLSSFPTSVILFHELLCNWQVGNCEDVQLSEKVLFKTGGIHVCQMMLKVAWWCSG